MIFWQPEGGGSGGNPEEDYLSKLAKSILSKEKPVQRPSGEEQPVPPNQESASPQRQRPATPTWQKEPEAAPCQPQQSAPAPQADPAVWTRDVQMTGDNGEYLPGTILVFEDGNVFIYKEHNAAKDYDIVYQLMDSGRAAPQGVPVRNYDVTPIGRLSAMCLDHLVKSNQWERDMMVFHLLKYKDIAYIPQIDTSKGAQRRSSTIAPRLSEKELRSQPPAERQAPATTEPDSGAASQLKPGRQLKIDFGPGRSWDAVYWGKDELGHVVAHHTHNTWSLMHLDLGRFSNSVEYGDLADDATIETIQKDINSK